MLRHIAESARHRARARDRSRGDPELRAGGGLVLGLPHPIGRRGPGARVSSTPPPQAASAGPRGARSARLGTAPSLVGADEGRLGTRGAAIASPWEDGSDAREEAVTA